MIRQDALESLHPRVLPSPRSSSGSGATEPLGNMLDDDRQAAESIKYAFGEDTMFYRAIVRDGRWAKGLAQALMSQ